MDMAGSYHDVMRSRDWNPREREKQNAREGMKGMRRTWMADTIIQQAERDASKIVQKGMSASLFSSR